MLYLIIAQVIAVLLPVALGIDPLPNSVCRARTGNAGSECRDGMCHISKKSHWFSKAVLTNSQVGCSPDYVQSIAALYSEDLGISEPIRKEPKSVGACRAALIGIPMSFDSYLEKPRGFSFFGPAKCSTSDLTAVIPTISRLRALAYKYLLIPGFAREVATRSPSSSDMYIIDHLLQGWAPALLVALKQAVRHGHAAAATELVLVLFEALARGAPTDKSIQAEQYTIVAAKLVTLVGSNKLFTQIRGEDVERLRQKWGSQQIPEYYLDDLYLRMQIFRTVREWPMDAKVMCEWKGPFAWICPPSSATCASVDWRLLPTHPKSEYKQCTESVTLGMKDTFDSIAIGFNGLESVDLPDAEMYRYAPCGKFFHLVMSGFDAVMAARGSGKCQAHNLGELVRERKGLARPLITLLQMSDRIPGILDGLIMKPWDNTVEEASDALPLEEIRKRHSFLNPVLKTFGIMMKQSHDESCRSAPAVTDALTKLDYEGNNDDYVTVIQAFSMSLAWLLAHCTTSAS